MKDLAYQNKFDPVRGCQNQSTGIFGGLFILLLTIAYGIFQAAVLPGGGPKVPEVFSWYPAWFPESFQFAGINRNYYDILAIVVLGFLGMVCWEFLRRPLLRAYILGLALLSVFGAFSLANHAQWFFAGDTHTALGWNWNRFEVVLAFCTLGYTLPWLLYPVVKRETLVITPFAQAFRSAFFRWVSGLVVFTLLVFISFQHPFYGNNYYENWRITCGYLYSLYLLLGLPYALITCLLRGHRFEDRSDPNFVLLMLFRRALRRIFGIQPARLHWKITNKRIGIALRDLCVKLFWIPLMITFLYLECNGLFANATPFWNALVNGEQWRNAFNYFYGSYFHGLFVMDVSIGLIGYLAASRWLNNKSKSVDPTLFGWFITLACYPPFNGVVSGYLPYGNALGNAPYAIFQPEWVDVLLKSLTLVCFTVYVWATLVFGLRFSNLTNRGIITTGPFSIIRHPAYTMKNIAWWLENLRNFGSPWQFFFLAMWNVIYYLRAITEERHLRRDPDYLAYCQRVKYKFIPGVW